MFSAMWDTKGNCRSHRRIRAEVRKSFVVFHVETKLEQVFTGFIYRIFDCNDMIENFHCDRLVCSHDTVWVESRFRSLCLCEILRSVEVLLASFGGRQRCRHQWPQAQNLCGRIEYYFWLLSRRHTNNAYSDGDRRRLSAGAI